MKLIFSLSLILLIVYCCNTAEASKIRRKRALAIEKCPEGSSIIECQAYAEKESKNIKYCHTYKLGADDITWVSCGVVACGEGAVRVEENLSLPYPDCCARCAEA